MEGCSALIAQHAQNLIFKLLILYRIASAKKKKNTATASIAAVECEHLKLIELD